MCNDKTREKIKHSRKYKLQVAKSPTKESSRFLLLEAMQIVSQLPNVLLVSSVEARVCQVMLEEVVNWGVVFAGLHDMYSLVVQVSSAKKKQRKERCELQCKSSQIAFVEKRVEKMQGSAYPLYDHRNHPTSPTHEYILPQTLPVSPSFNSISILPNKKPRQSEAQSGHNNIIHHGRKSGRAAFFLFGRDNPPGRLKCRVARPVLVALPHSSTEEGEKKGKPLGILSTPKRKKAARLDQKKRGLWRCCLSATRGGREQAEGDDGNVQQGRGRQRQRKKKQRRREKRRRQREREGEGREEGWSRNERKWKRGACV